MEKNVRSKDSLQSRGVPNHQQECKGVQRYNQYFLHMGLLSHDYKPHNIHTQRDHLHCIYHMQVQNKQNRINIRRYQNILYASEHLPNVLHTSEPLPNILHKLEPCLIYYMHQNHCLMYYIHQNLCILHTSEPLPNVLHISEPLPNVYVVLGSYK